MVKEENCYWQRGECWFGTERDLSVAQNRAIEYQLFSGLRQIMATIHFFFFLHGIVFFIDSFIVDLTKTPTSFVLFFSYCPSSCSNCKCSSMVISSLILLCKFCFSSLLFYVYLYFNSIFLFFSISLSSSILAFFYKIAFITRIFSPLTFSYYKSHV